MFKWPDVKSPEKKLYTAAPTPALGATTSGLLTTPTAPLPDTLLPDLKAAYKRRKTDHVIEYNGKLVKSIKTAFKEACQAAGLTGITPHVLKHTAITWLMQQGLEITVVSGWTGTLETTIREVYGHHHPNYIESAKAAADRTIRPEYGQIENEKPSRSKTGRAS